MVGLPLIGAIAAPPATSSSGGDLVSISSLSQLHVAPLTKSDKRRDFFLSDLSIFPGYSKTLRNMHSRSTRDLQGSFWKGPDAVITWEARAALEIHASVPSLDLSSPAGPAPLGSFIFALMAALDNGTAEKSRKSKSSTSDVTGRPWPPVDWCSRVQLDTCLRSISDAAKGRFPPTPTHSLTLPPKWDI